MTWIFQMKIEYNEKNTRIKCNVYRDICQFYDSAY